MNGLTQWLHSGTDYGWWYAPAAIVLGSLHGLEPGHSKTLMAALIVAIRGSWRQAVLLGVAAAASHTFIVWLVALAGLYFGSRFSTATVEPWLQIASGCIIVLLALWMLWRTGAIARHHGHDHSHGHAHDSDDAHEREHRESMHRALDRGPMTNRRLLLFGLTGGLIPCPASITVLMICLQLKQIALGSMLVLCFGIGLALTLVLTGIVAAAGARHLARRFAGLEHFADRVPWISGTLMLCVSAYMIMLGVNALRVAG